MIIFSLKEGWLSFRNLGLLGLLTLLMLTITLTLLGITFTGYKIIKEWNKGLLGRFEIEAFFKDDADSLQIKSALNTILNHPYVKSAQLISREDALKRFNTEFKTDLLEVLNYNPLPASIVVKLATDTYPQIAWQSVSNALKDLPGIDEVIYEGELLSQIQKLYTDIGKKTSFAVGIALIISVILSILTVTSAIKSRLDFIKVILLSGGTCWMARGPFTALGAYYGLFAGLLSSVITYAGFNFLTYGWGLTIQLEFIKFLVLIIIGIIIGALSATFAAGKWIKGI